MGSNVKLIENVLNNNLGELGGVRVRVENRNGYWAIDLSDDKGNIRRTMATNMDRKGLIRTLKAMDDLVWAITGEKGGGA